MKRSSRLLTGLLSVTLLFGIFTAGCASSNSGMAESTTKATQAVTTQSSGGETKAQEPAFKELDLSLFTGGYGDTWDQILVKFKEAYPNVKITTDFDPKNHERLRTRLVAGNPPDVVMINYGNFDLFGAIASGQFRDMNDLFEETVPGKGIKYKDLFKEEVISMSTIDGKIMVAPSDTGFQGLFYNKKLFRDNGWEVPQDLDEFMEVCEKIKSAGIAPLCYQGLYPAYLIFGYLVQAVAANGGRQVYLDAFCNLEKGAWHTEPVKKAVQSLKDMQEKGYIMEGTTALNHTQSQMEFLNGRAAFITCGTWFENEMKESIPEDFEIGFICPFKNSNGQQVVCTMQNFFAVPAKCKNYEGAKEWIKFCYNEFSQEVYAAHTMVPYQKDISASALSIFSESMQEIIKYGTGDNVVYTEKMAEIFYPTLCKVIGDNITLLVLGEESVDDFCNNVEAEAERIRNDDTVKKYKLN